MLHRTMPAGPHSNRAPRLSMRRLGLRAAIAFDKPFEEEGFRLDR